MAFCDQCGFSTHGNDHTLPGGDIVCGPCFAKREATPAGGDEATVVDLPPAEAALQDELEAVAGDDGLWSYDTSQLDGYVSLTLTRARLRAMAELARQESRLAALAAFDRADVAAREATSAFMATPHADPAFAGRRCEWDIMRARREARWTDLLDLLVAQRAGAGVGAAADPPAGDR